MKTELNDRILWYDGTSQVKPDIVPDLLLMGVPPDRLATTEFNDDIRQFNQVMETMITTEKSGNAPFDFTWQIPEEFKQMDLEKYALSKVSDPVYIERVKAEMSQIRTFEIEMIFKTLVYVVAVLKEQKQVWGVGRGSSCASLILHLIGVHEVDPIKYGIPASEFFHS